MNDNQRLALSLTLRQHWPTLLAVLALLLAAFLWQRGENAIAEADTLRARVNLAATLADEEKRFEEVKARVAAAEARLLEVEARETTLYPELERKRAEAGRLWVKIQKRQKELKALAARPLVVENLTDLQLSAEFERLGYPNTITPEVLHEAPVTATPPLP